MTIFYGRLQRRRNKAAAMAAAAKEIREQSIRTPITGRPLSL